MDQVKGRLFVDGEEIELVEHPSKPVHLHGSTSDDTDLFKAEAGRQYNALFYGRALDRFHGGKQGEKLHAAARARFIPSNGGRGYRKAELDVTFKMLRQAQAVALTHVEKAEARQDEAIKAIGAKRSPMPRRRLKRMAEQAIKVARHQDSMVAA